MPLNSLGVGFAFTATDLASGVIGRLERNFGSLERRSSITASVVGAGFRVMGVGAASMAAGVGILGAAFAAADIAGQFEQSMAAVAAVASDGREHLSELRDAALAAGVATQYGPGQAAEALQNLAQAGFDSRRSIELLNPALHLAAASLGRVGVGGAAELLAQAMHAFPDAAADANLAVDQMANVANISALSVEELQMALGNATRGASVFGASFSTTLTALGLVRNIIPGIERASTGLAVAMERMTGAETQAAIAAQTHVQVIDQNTGHFRDFLDILAEMGPALAEMTDAQRAQFLTSTFGAHAMGAVNAVLTQLRDGVHTSTGEILRGAAAVNYLRENMAGASGAADTFASAMLDTFPGQMQLLRGSLETLAIEFGTPFAQVMRPAVEAVLGAVNKLIQAWHNLSPEAQHLIGQLMVLAGTTLTAFGAFSLVVGAVMVAGPFIEAIAATFAGLTLTLAPLIAGFIALKGIVYGFRRAWDEDLGGVASRFQRYANNIRVAWTALSELFSEGSMSQATSRELSASGNVLRDFVISIFRIGFRIRRFVEGISAGFTEFWGTIEPSFNRLSQAMTELMEAFGFVSEEADKLAASPSTSWAERGILVGRALGRAFEFVVQAVTVTVRVFRGLVDGFRQGWKQMTLYTAPLMDAFSGLGSALMRLGVSLGLVDGDMDSSAVLAETFGNVLGQVVAGALAFVIDTIRTGVNMITMFTDSLNLFVAGARLAGAGIIDFLVIPFLQLENRIDSVMATMGRAAAMVPPEFRTSGMDQLVSRGAEVQTRVDGRTAEISGIRGRTQSATEDYRHALAQSQTARESGEMGPEMRALMETLGRDRDAERQRVIQVHSVIAVDGERLAESNSRSNQGRRALAFAGNIT